MQPVRDFRIHNLASFQCCTPATTISRSASAFWQRVTTEPCSEAPRFDFFARPLSCEMSGVLLAVVLMLNSIAVASSANITLLPLSSGAAALDGSPYGFYFEKYAGNVPAHNGRWTISIEGGGWCVGIEDCYSRSQQRTHDGKPGSLGSSIPYAGQEHGCGCMNTNSTDVLSKSCNCIMMLYLDGGSFSGNVADPVPVPGRAGRFVHYRGLRNLDATLDYAFEHLGLDRATELVVTGGSAGGLSTFLHLDHIAQRMKLSAPSCALVTGAPVVGYFLDHPNYAQLHPPVAASPLSAHSKFDQISSSYPHTGNYSSWMETVVSDQNATAALLPECLMAFADRPHLCFMSPHAVEFVRTPFFMFNSKFDAWQSEP